MEQPDPGIQFLCERNRRFHRSAEVTAVLGYLTMNGQAVSDRPVHRVAAYIDFLAQPDYANDGLLTGDPVSLGRQIEHALIKKEDVPLNKGDDPRLPAIIQQNQRVRLGAWAFYLGRNDAKYPDWFRWYAFDAVKKLGPPNTAKDNFRRRVPGTTATFPALHTGALARVYDMLVCSKIKDKVVSGRYEDSEQETNFQQALRNGDFARLYAHALRVSGQGHITPEQRAMTKGVWKKYNQGEDARALLSSLQGFGLDWCTSEGYATAEAQLKEGDFYVFYTEAGADNVEVPRLAVRMEAGSVAEARGIEDNQEVEEVLLETLYNKLNTLPGNEKFLQRIRTLQRLNTLARRLEQKPGVRLKKAELLFLYELEHTIDTFSLDSDTRLSGLRQLREGGDVSSLRRLLPEALQHQIGAAYTAYTEVASQLGIEVLSRRQIDRLFRTQLRQWRRSDVYRHLADTIANNDITYNLIITPNHLAAAKQIIALTQRFAETSGIHTSRGFWHFYEQCTPSELSGPLGHEPVKWRLISSGISNPDEEDEQYQTDALHALRQTQRKYPNLGLMVPSVLDAISFWHTLRAAGTDLAKLDDERTGISHITVPPKPVDTKLKNELRIPYTGLGTDSDGIVCAELSLDMLISFHKLRLAISGSTG